MPEDISLQSKTVVTKNGVDMSKNNQPPEVQVNVNDLLAQMARLQEQVIKANDQAAAARAEAEQFRLRAASGTRPFTCKVSDKGGVSVYGLGRFPVTLYKSQWDELFKNAETVKQFITENNGKLSEKPPAAGRPQGSTNKPKE